jgi:stage V sporulation protein B
MCRIFFNCPQAGNLLYWASFSCIFEYWHITLFAIMNGLGMQKKVLENSIYNIIIILFLGYFLIPLEGIGIYGYIIAFSISAIFVTLSCLQSLKKIQPLQLNYSNVLAKPVICFFISILVIIQTNLYFIHYSHVKYNMVLSSLIGFLAYFVLLVFTGIFTVNQLKNTFHIK